MLRYCWRVLTSGPEAWRERFLVKEAGAVVVVVPVGEEEVCAEPVRIWETVVMVAGSTPKEERTARIDCTWAEERPEEGVADWVVGAGVVVGAPGSGLGTEEKPPAGIAMEPPEEDAGVDAATGQAEVVKDWMEPRPSPAELVA